jgi:hypothetical protein
MEFLIALVIISLIYFTTRYFQIREAKRHHPNPALDTLNTTNYNIKRLDDEELRDLSPEEAEQLVNYWRKSGFTPSHREFYAVKRILRRDAKEKLQELQEA